MVIANNVAEDRLLTEKREAPALAAAAAAVACPFEKLCTTASGYDEYSRGINNAYKEDGKLTGCERYFGDVFYFVDTRLQ